VSRAEAVHQREQLVERVVVLLVAAGALVAPRAERIDLVDEENAPTISPNLASPRAISRRPRRGMAAAHGARRAAASKTPRTRRAPRPTKTSTNSEPAHARKGTPAEPATALARSVLPVPGGPAARQSEAA